ncbi:MAG: YciI family protein, partial [Chloroflexi bacterium]|nr:YciI family protein [Chloroflexota bacterium]
YRDESVQLPFDIVQEQGAFSDDAREQGAYISGDGLDAIATAMTVRVRDDKVLVTDGPFVESKEVLGGFHILECDDIDAAIEYAAKNPTSKVGAVEIRPIMEL